MLFFVARESKRLQASEFAASDCRQMLPCRVPLLRACTPVAKSLAWAKEPASKKCYLAKSEQRLLDTSCRSPQTPALSSSVGIVALLGPTRTSCAALQAQRRVRNARGSLFEASDAACTSRIRRTSGVKREGASTADGAAS